MTFVTPCSIGNIYLFPKTSACTTRKKNLLAKCSSFGKSSKLAFPPQRFLVPPPPSSRLFPEHRSRRLQILATVETDVAIEESTSSTEGGDVKTSEAPSTAPETSEPPAAQSKRPRFIRKSEMPPVKTEELVPGATFTGKVRSIQPFGAFVDFGAFTDGLVHVSRMSDSFIKDVNSVVSIGQEVQVRIVEADAETGRISLTMRGSDDITKLQQQKDGSSSEPTDKQRFPRKNASRSNQKQGTQKASKFVKDQILEGTVKNLTRAGAFISLPDGEEGFLPTSEESEGLAVVMGTSSLQPGQEVSVRVLRITRGNVTLTMKKEENMDEINAKFSQGVVHVATNPFLLAFRDNKDVAAFLDEREKLQKAKALEKIEAKVEQVETESKVTQDKKSPEVVEKEDETVVASVETESNTLTDGAPITTEEKEESNEANLSDEKGDHVPSPENLAVDEAPIRDELSRGANGTDEPSKAGDQVPTPEIAVLEATPTINDLTEESKETESPTELGDQITALESLATEEVVLSQDGDDSVKNEVEIQASQTVEKELHSSESEDVKAGPSVPEQNGSITSNEQTQIESEISTKASTISPALVKQLREETGAGMMDCKKALTETGGDITKAQEFLRKKGLASAEKKASRATAEGRIGSYIHDNRIGVLIEVNCETDFVSRGDIFKELVDDLAMQVAACPQVKYLKTEDVSEEIVNKEREIEMQKEDLLSKPEQIRMKIVEGRIRKRLEELALLEQPYIKNDKMVVKDWVKQTIATIGENMKVRRFIRYNLGEGLEKKSQDFAAEVAAQTAAKPSPALPNDQSAVEPQETSEKPTIAISAALVKQLREETGAGMMDCKKALTETSGNLEKAQEYLRKKGLSAADKKSSRLAAEGRISSYIHDSRIGVLIEVNCETDFVGRSEKFKELVDDLAMQVVAYPQVQYVSMEDIPPTMVSKERELEMQREDLQSKPENIREKIVDGRVAKRLGELALLEQPFIKNDNVLVKDLVKQTVAAIGENIRVRRFVRFTLGEAIVDEKTAEVAEA